MCQKLAQYRAERGETQAEMADKIGVSQVAYSRWETGQRRPRDRYLAKIVIVTGGHVTPNDFYGLGVDAAFVDGVGQDAQIGGQFGGQGAGAGEDGQVVEAGQDPGHVMGGVMGGGRQFGDGLLEGGVHG